MHRAMVGYQLNEGFALQLNVDNLFDKQYFTRIRNNGWATPGAARLFAKRPPIGGLFANRFWRVGISPG